MKRAHCHRDFLAAAFVAGLEGEHPDHADRDTRFTPFPLAERWRASSLRRQGARQRVTLARPGDGEAGGLDLATRLG